MHSGLFVHKQGRRKKRSFKVAHAKAKEVTKKAKKSTKKARGKKARLRKAKAPPAPIPEKLENFKRHGVGVELVKQVMERAKSTDDSKFSDRPLFDADGKLKMKIDQCFGMPWDKIQTCAHPFFKAQYLVLCSVLIKEAQVFFCPSMSKW